MRLLTSCAIPVILQWNRLQHRKPPWRMMRRRRRILLFSVSSNFAVVIVQFLISQRRKQLFLLSLRYAIFAVFENPQQTLLLCPIMHTDN